MLPSLHVPLESEPVARKLEQAGRRGRLPGLRRDSEGAIRLDADGTPFEHDLVLRLEPAEDGTTVSFELRRRLTLPLVFAAVLAFTVWPGVWLTDSILKVYWATYSTWVASMPWLTYAWYLPITVLPLPWAWRSCSRRSLREAEDRSAKLVAAVRRVLGVDE